ncbi:MAG: Ig-like domain-containing protein, partial [Blastocatellia bacterium]
MPITQSDGGHPRSGLCSLFQYVSGRGAGRAFVCRALILLQLCQPLALAGGLAYKTEARRMAAPVVSPPPAPPGITLVSGAPVTTGPNLLVNGDFELGGTVCGGFWGINDPETQAIPGWSRTGGGTDTYAQILCNADSITGASAYFGNGYVRQVSPAGRIRNGFTYTADGEVTNMPDNIVLRGPADDVAGVNYATPGATNGECCDLGGGGGGPVTLSQTVATQPGGIYRLHFTSKGEPNNSSNYWLPGVFTMDLPGGSVNLQVPAGTAPSRDFTVQFVAAGAATAISFKNYGHFYVDDDPCNPATTADCTIDGIKVAVPGVTEKVSSNELILDNISMVAMPVVQAYKSVKLTSDADNSGSVTAGDGLTWTIHYVNTGAGAATGFQISDALPAGVTITAAGAQVVAASGAGTSAGKNNAYTGAGVNGLLSAGAALGASGVISVSIPVTVNAGFSGALSNQAVATAANLLTASAPTDAVDSATTGLPAGVAIPPASITQTQTAATEPAIVNVTVLAPPVAANDSATTTGTTPVAVDIDANDTPGTGVLDPSKIDLDPTTPAIDATLTIPGQGTFTLNTNNGEVTFRPVAPFTGVVSIPYTIRNTLGLVSNQATITITVNAPAAPVAANDSAIGGFNQPVTLAPAGNDTPGQTATLDTTKIDLDPSTPGQDTTRTTADGAWTLDTSTGQVTFTPVNGYTGTTSIPYTIRDNYGMLSNQAALSVTINAVVIPVAVNDSGATVGVTPVTLDIDANDTPGAGTLDPTKIDLDPSTPVIDTTRTIAGRGTFTLNTANGEVTFTPLAPFTGVVAIPYTIQNTLGSASNQATITITVTAPPAPVAANDSATTPLNTPVTLMPAANDTAGGAATLVLSRIDLNPDAPGVDTMFVVTGQGAFTLNPATGQVAFTPVTGYTGVVSIPYVIADNYGTLSNRATITITINAATPPVAANDSGATIGVTPVTLDIDANDTPGAGALDLASIDLDPSTPAIDTTRAVTGSGTFALNTTTGEVTFTPLAPFTGVVAIPYTIRNTAGGVSNQATVTITVTAPPAPVAANDSATTPLNTPVTLTPAVNDAAGGGAVLEVSRIDLNPDTPGVDNTRTVARQGTFTLNPATGQVVFTPVTGYTGAVSIPYTIADNYGTLSNRATITITISGPPQMVDVTAADNPSLPPVKLVENRGQVTVPPGAALHYSIVFRNRGAVIARNVLLGDDLPAALDYVAGSMILGTRILTDAADTDEGRVTGRRVEVLLPQVQPDETVTVLFQARLNAGVIPGAGIVNTATISGENVRTLVRTSEAVAVVNPLGTVYAGYSGGSLRIPGARIALTSDLAGTQPIALTSVAGFAPNAGNANPFSADAQGNFSYVLPASLLTPGTAATYYVHIAAPGYRSRVLQVSVTPAPGGLYSVTVRSQDGQAIAQSGSFLLTSNDVTLSNLTALVMNIPLFELATLELSKTVDRQQAEVGEMLNYRVELRNATSGRIDDARIVDTLPASFNYVPGTARIQVANAPAFGMEPAVNGNVMTLRIGSIGPGERVAISYRLRIGVNAGDGEQINAAIASGTFAGGEPVSTPPARASVFIGGGVFAMRQVILGRVFEDPNGNGLFDKNERAVAGARVYLTNGMSVITDSQGMFNFPSVEQGAQVVSLDPVTVPEGYALHENGLRSGRSWTRLLRTPLGGGGLLRANFPLTRMSGAAGGDDEIARTRRENEVKLAQLSKGAATSKRSRSAYKTAENDEIAVVVDGPIQRLEITTDKNELRAGGRESTPVRIRAYDDQGNLISHGEVVVETSAGRLLPQPGSPAAESTARARRFSNTVNGRNMDNTRGLPGEQASVTGRQQVVRIENGEAMLTLLSAGAPGRASLIARTANQTGQDQTARGQVEFRAEQRPQILVGLAEVSAGSAAPDIAARGDSRNVRAHTEFYFRGEMIGHSLLTLAYNSWRPLSRTAGRDRLFSFDPIDRVYSVFGDSSTLFQDAMSNSKLYARIDKGRSYALFGDFDVSQDNYQTSRDNPVRSFSENLAAQTVGVAGMGMNFSGYSSFNNNGPQLTNYARRLTGVKLHLENTRGDYLTATGARPDTAFARDVFPGSTPGLLRLSHTDIMQGSETLVLEVRDRRNPEMILSRNVMARNVDYNIDTRTGLVYFLRPISTLDYALNLVQVVATYEHRSIGMSSAVYTARGSAHVGESGLRLGVSLINQRQDQFGDYYLGGVDLEQRMPNQGTLQFEWGMSRGQVAQAGNLYTQGLALPGPGPLNGFHNGNAFRGELRQPLGWAEAVLQASFLKTDRSFLNPFGATVTPGSQRVAAALDVRPRNRSILRMGFTDERNQTDYFNNERQTVSIGWLERMGDRLRLSFGYDYRHFSDRTGNITGPAVAGVTGGRDIDSHLVTAGVEIRPTDRLQLAVKREQNLGDADPTYPDQTTIGAAWQVNSLAKMYFTQRLASSPITPISDGLLTGFAGLGSTRETAIGVETALGRYTSLSSRYQLNSGIGGADSFAVIGLINRLPVSKQLSLDLGYERGMHLAGNGQGFNNASLGFTWQPGDSFRAASRYELRDLNGFGNVFTLGAAGKIGNNLTTLGRMQYARGDFQGRGNRSWNGLTALAWRPGESDRTALLLSYTRRQYEQRDLAILNAALDRDDVLSMDGLYQPLRRLELYGRFALRYNENGRADTPLASTLTALWQGRAEYRFSRLFDLAGEGRTFLQPSQATRRNTFGTEFGLWVFPDLRFAGGYNFTQSYEQYGFFGGISNTSGQTLRRGVYFTISSKLSNMFNL